jgi:recombinational DNA repair ATPase RecF
VIRIDSILIEDFRGIRRMPLSFDGQNYAICGRNGTGKSGIVDALEFGLTGSISRLAGEGSDRLSVKAHAPHVDARSNPELAQVTIKGSIPSLRKDITITRNVSRSKAPTISPADADVIDILNRIAGHPELVLTRREIIRYVLATEGDRAQEVQAVLKLDRLEAVRSALTTITNTANRDAKSAAQTASAAGDALTKALGISALSEAALLGAVNVRRQVVGLQDLKTIAPPVSLTDGIAARAVKAGTLTITKSSGLQDVAEVRSLIKKVADLTETPDAKSALAICADLQSDPETLKALAHDSFLKTGLSFIEDRCPFCDHEWQPDTLREHIRSKIASIDDARKKRTEAENCLVSCIATLEQLSQALKICEKYAIPANVSIPPSMGSFRRAVDGGAQVLRRFLPVHESVSTLSGPPAVPEDVLGFIDAIDRFLTSLPDPSSEEAARQYLVVGQEKLEAYREARRRKAKRDSETELARVALTTYANTMNSELTALYREVEGAFASMYAALNTPDEAEFQAKLTPSIGKLGFDVNFYGRGFFPPGAYHSEGHQDAMGLCLYLALMNHVLKDNFTFAVLDDVLMSVDAGHRRAVCTLLKTRFPHTQFILTTHDRVWLNHMKTEALIAPKSLVYFHSWDVATGPAFWDDVDVWDQIDAELKRDRVPVAAELLRNYLEYISGELCQRLRARVPFKLDGRMELGELLPFAYQQMGDLFAKGKGAANSWGNTVLKDSIAQRHDELRNAYQSTSIDQWQVNAAVHYNSWASLDRNDFAPVVTAFKRLIAAFRCSNPDCLGFRIVLREAGTDKVVSCPCGTENFSLVNKVAK